MYKLKSLISEVVHLNSINEIDPLLTESIFDNPNFKKWFKNSKVVDKNGNPLVVYHGTKSAFKHFDLKKFGASDQGIVGKGFYFTYSGHEAGEYSLNVQYGKGENPNVVPCYISIQNPFIITRGGIA